jgi:GWxTD domain-containing protein
MKNLLGFFALVLVLAIFNSCSQQNNLAKYNLAPNYTDQYAGRFMDQQIYHVNDTMSELYIRLVPAQIPNIKAKQLELYSYLTLTYSVYSSSNKKDLVQTNTYKLTDLMPFEDMADGVIKLSIPLKLVQNYNYIVLVSVQNPVDKQNFLSYNSIYKDNTSAENYKILDEKGEIIWKNWLANQQNVSIQYRYQDSSSIWLSYFKPTFSPALPPFSAKANKDFDVTKPFEQFELQLTNGKTAVIELSRKGLYKIHNGKNQFFGKTILKLYENYPSIASDAQKVFGLRYLTPQKEFSMMLKDDPEHTLKEFWFFEDRTEERSKSMIKTYYARMLRANKLFTSYKEGWKTDRGMVFMIYGPPDQVYYEQDREVWEYGPDAGYNDLRFSFFKASPFLSSNNWILERNADFKQSWYRLLENWRND